MNIKDTIKKKLSIPDYMSKYVDATINLNETTKICCPFHKEDTPSFSYNPHKGVWRCFGSCKTGGDVIAMHKHYHKIKSYEEATKSLALLLGIDDTPTLTFDFYAEANKAQVQHALSYHEALMLADNPKDWIELDYIMSQHVKTVEQENMLIAYSNERRERR